MADLVKTATAKGNRVLFFVHVAELVKQVRDDFERNGADMSLVTTGTVQSLVRRLDKIPEPTIILVDEAHHVTAKSYHKILEHFPSAYKLLFTGTPIRLNGEGFDGIADDLVLGKPIKWLQENGNIAHFKYYGLTLIDSNKLKKERGEFSNNSINTLFDEVEIYGDVVSNYRKLADGQQAIVYCHAVEAAQAVADEFQKNGYSAKALHGKIPPKERDEMLVDFKSQQLKILTNVNIATEGFDLPNVDVCIMLRPTASLSLYLQFSMRPLNPREGKTAILIDHVGNASRHGLPNQDREWSLSGRKKETLPITECPSCFMVFESAEILRNDMGNRLCPHCGFEFIAEPKSKKQKEKVKGELVELTEENLIVLRKSVNQCKTIDELEVFRKSKGYKPGWTMFIAQERGMITSRKDLATIAKARGYASGWIYHQAKKLGLKS